MARGSETVAATLFVLKTVKPEDGNWTITFKRPIDGELVYSGPDGTPAIAGTAYPDSTAQAKVDMRTIFYTWSKAKQVVEWSDPALLGEGKALTGSVPVAPFSPAQSSQALSSVSPVASAPATGEPVPSPNNPSMALAPSTATITPTTASNATAAIRNRPNHNNVTSGAAAGIAIGCLIAGALIAGLVFWLCSRRKKGLHPRDHGTSSIALVNHEKGFAAKATSLGSRSPMSDVLPLPLEDKTVTGEISKISSSIKNHVQSYYHADRVNAALLDLDDIQAIGSSLPVSVGTISTLLANTATREIALRFCIAWVVCSKILPEKGSTGLLPLEVAGCFQQITNAHKGPSGE